MREFRPLFKLGMDFCARLIQTSTDLTCKLNFFSTELKRRLDDDKTPLPKRLCLAKNVVQSHHFPTAPKERIVAEWLHALTEKNRLNSDDLKNVLNWLSAVDDLTSELKSKLIQVCMSMYLFL